MKTLIELFGWYGMIAIVSAYALISFSVIQSTDFAYQALNASGALGIVIVSFNKRAYQPGVLNVIWLVIAVVAIAKMLL